MLGAWIANEGVHGRADRRARSKRVFGRGFRSIPLHSQLMADGTYIVAEARQEGTLGAGEKKLALLVDVIVGCGGGAAQRHS